MKTYMRVAVLFIVVVALMIVAYATRKVSAPESAIIAAERNRVFAARDKVRMEKDPGYAIEMRDKLEFLEYRVAAAYNAENNPDAAIKVLQTLIEEEARTTAGTPRRSRSYANEARYYEALQTSYELKKDAAGVQQAEAARAAAMAKAAEAGKRESSEDGKYVGSVKE